MSLLEARELTVEIGGRVVLEGFSMDLRSGDKVGLVGRNGAGKTSLLRTLAGEAPPAHGTVRRRAAIGYLPQEPRLRGVDGDRLGIAHVLSGRGLDALAAEVADALRALERHHGDREVGRFARLEERFRTAGGYEADAEARRMAAELGLRADGLEIPIRALSGGERRRLELARILFAGSQLLLLDEPTNHLDNDAKAWLMEFLASFHGGLVVVSHDLALLDRSITRIVHLDDDGVSTYRGTYSRYVDARERGEARLAALAERQQAEIRRLEALADSMRGQTEKRARKAKTLDTRVERLRRRAVAAPKRSRSVRYRFPEPPRSGRVSLVVERLAKGYGGPAVFEDVEFDVGRGERLLVMGLNGAGKTSLLRILAGVSQADAGEFRLGHGAALGYYAQEHENIRGGATVLAHMREASAAVGDQDLRVLLGMFGLTGDVAFREAGTLSGGEKTKLALAQLVAGRRNLLLLDEPTNNLDPPSRAAVARALADWPGTMVLVSHDVEFVRALAPDRVLLMPDGTLDHWSEDLLELVALA